MTRDLDKLIEEIRGGKRPKIDIIYYDDIYSRIFKYLIKIRDERNQAYGDNWALYSDKTCIAAAFYKCDRAMMTLDKKKRLDDIIDAINYLIFAANKLLDEVEENEGK